MNESLALHSLQKSAYVVREMTRYYFPLYDVDPRDYLTFGPRLMLCEAIVFDVDRDLESGASDVLERVAGARDRLAGIVAEDGILDGPTAKELDRLVEYAHLEGHLVRRGAAAPGEVWRACDLRTSDVRLLHRVLVRMLGETYREDWFDIMWPLECLMDVELDLDDYAEDAATGSYNTLLALERALGEREARTALLGRIAYYEELFRYRLERADRPTRDRFERLRRDYRRDHPMPPIPAPAGSAAARRLAARVV